MLRCAFIAASLLLLAFAAGVPTEALAHGDHSHAMQTEIAGEEALSSSTAQSAGHEAVASTASLHSESVPRDLPTANDCHCPACHGCCHAPALSDAPAQFVPLALRSHAAPRDHGWFVRRAASAIENPPKSFA